ncbi:carbohydrate-binding protein, partial [Myxococcus sp. AM011]|uniref:MYXO-CTERM sorting domain-containing protein n=2 Tax=Myxococcus TaxID=32 RepID=UPI001805D298
IPTPPVISVPTLPGTGTPNVGVVNDDNGPNNPLSDSGPQGCGASATGGAPFVAATALLAMAGLLSRRRKPAEVRARRR